MNMKWESGPGFSLRYKAMLAAAPTPQEPDVIEHRNIKDVIGEWLAGIISSDNALEERKYL